MLSFCNFNVIKNGVGRLKHIWLLLLLLISIATNTNAQTTLKNITFDFYGDTIELPFNGASFVDLKEHLSEPAVLEFYTKLDNAHFEATIAELKACRETYKLDDWMYYQLIRKTAEAISPKKADYIRYTLYKWYFLQKSGYDAEVAIAGDTILFYAQCDENIYDIPSFTRNGKQYVCLNYHDYGHGLDLPKTTFYRIRIAGGEKRSFSYKLTHMPVFRPSDYKVKDINFSYQDVVYHFKVKVNEEVKSLYANYPVADYQLYFDMPMSQETYNSLVPKIKEVTADMSTKSGIDYLMRFTRYAFLYEADKDNFGKEKRLSPEQTLLYEHSDCEDRSALFYFLVKEIYNLPMIVLAYPKHVTIAVKLNKASGTPIIYNGEKYYVCEPTPQGKDLQIGQLSKELKTEPYEIAFAYKP